MIDRKVQRFVRGAYVMPARTNLGDLAELLGIIRTDLRSAGVRDPEDGSTPELVITENSGDIMITWERQTGGEQ